MQKVTRNQIIGYLNQVIESNKEGKEMKYLLTIARPEWYVSLTDVTIDDKVVFQGKCKEEILLKFHNYLNKNFKDSISGKRISIIKDEEFDEDDNPSDDEAYEIAVSNLMESYGLSEDGAFNCDLYLESVTII